MQTVLNYLTGKETYRPTEICGRCHTSGVAYFNAFERTIDEYSLPSFEISQDIINRKGEDALNMVDTITAHWKMLRSLSEKHGLLAPEPSPTAYASLQRVIKRFYPSAVEEVSKKFRDAQLPVHGFESKTKHTGWKMKKNVTIQLVVGCLCIAIGGILAFVYKEPTAVQYMFLRGLFVLGFVGIAVGILVGTVKLKWSIGTSLLVTATGGFGLLILIYYWNPPPPPSPKAEPPALQN